MRSNIVRIASITFSTLMFYSGFSQGSISGSTKVQPGAVVFYSINWNTPPDEIVSITASVINAAAFSCDESSCQVTWSNTSGMGLISVNESEFGQSVQLSVQVGNPVVSVLPSSISVDFGSVVTQKFMGVVGSIDPPTSVKWQQSSDQITWTDISSSLNSYSFIPSSQFASFYRFAAQVDGTFYFSNPVSLTLNPLDPGSINLTLQPGYNTSPSVTNVAAHGGTCLSSAYTYSWEQSIDGQPWTTIGSGVNYPAGILITGKTNLRRKVTCNGVTATSNVLYIVPSYVSVDFENLNYVRSIDVYVGGINTWYQADQLSTDNKSQATTYLDGLGRPIQTVVKSASLSSGSWKDLVEPIVYDAAGRATKKFMPFPTGDNPGKFKAINVSSEQASFVTAKFGEPAGAPTYALTVYDNSPLNRVMNSYAPGQSWGGSGVGLGSSYDFNTVDEGVHIWSLSYSSSAIPTTSPTAVYPTGSLNKLTGIDEKGKKSITYFDISGQVILKKVQQLESGSGLTGQHAGWVCTYYVYNDLGQMCFTIAPKAVDYLDNNSWNLTQQLVDDLCFVVRYDGKGRGIVKKQPGIPETDVVYDQRDRPVFVQDANGKANNQWLVNLYDGLDRITSTGVLSINMTQALLQSYVDANTGNINLTRVTTTVGLADISVSGTQNGATAYLASNSITFYPNYTSDPGGSFVAYIDPNLGNTVTEGVPIADNTIPNTGSLITLTQTFYDDYSQATKSYTTADNSLFDPSTNLNAMPLPTQSTLRTRGIATVTKVKVITNPSDLTQGNWLETDNYYDDQGRVIQVLTDNSLGGMDVITNRFDFAGKLWGSCVKHMAGGPTQFSVVSKNSYDKQGRLTDVSKNFNNTFFKDLASYTYDEYGKLATKRLAPGYTGSGKSEMESLTYDYNIQGWLTGINKNYALSTNSYDQWNQFFGLYLGYANADNQFASPQWNGDITGAIWKSQGDNSMRKYDYTYDNLGRLTSGIFNQRKTPADGWSNSAVDLSEYITYADGNGNINTMKHMGVVAGTAGGVVVDDLLYNYGTAANTYSNRLSRVDERAAFTGNGQLGDFKDGANAAGSNDYTYDAGGNLVQDLNKGITDGASGGVVYNYLNKPTKITIAGKSIVQYTYDATGTKMSKTVTNLAVTPNTTSTTAYDGEFVYQDNNLLYVLHEEGRMKIITPIATPQLQLNAGSSGTAYSGKQGVFEYFIKDQLSNTRVVLTEEVQTELYTATMELSSAADPNLGTDEAKLFGQVDPNTGNPTASNEMTLTRTDRPTIWTGNTSAKVTWLTAAVSTRKVGPNMILKVSAGDVINATANYFYFTNNPTGSSTGVTDALNSLMGALLSSGASSVTKLNSSLIGGNLGATGSDFSNFIGNLPNTGVSTAPQSYLTMVFFDEQFNFIAPDPNAPGVGSGAIRVSSANDQNASLPLGQKAPKNGWVYIYLSNESNQDVYYDNLSISQQHGRISEENHYYAFGQKIAGICTHAFNKLENKYNYQGDYSEEESNTGWNEFDLRMYDPQIGRWIGPDPDDQFFSPYVGMGDNPISNVDPDGGDTDDIDGGGGPYSFTLQGVKQAWFDLGKCDFCETPDKAQNLAEFVVTAKVSVDKFYHALLKQDIEFDVGILKGIGKSAWNLMRESYVMQNPSAEFSVYSPQEIIQRHSVSLWQKINNTISFGDILFDPTGQKQKQYFSNLYFNFKYATPSDKGETVGKASFQAGLLLAGPGYFGEAAAGDAMLAPVVEDASFYPPNGGALGDWESEVLMPGTEIDRFGSDFGKYFSPRGTPMEMRALPIGEKRPYSVFQVIKPLEVQSSKIAPWFNQPGLGTQYMTSENVMALIEKGFIVIIP